jgi:hypothetical protein
MVFGILNSFLGFLHGYHRLRSRAWANDNHHQRPRHLRPQQPVPTRD